jgi:hypothetical protein
VRQRDQPARFPRAQAQTAVGGIGARRELSRAPRADRVGSQPS